MFTLAIKDLKLFFADKKAMILGFAVPIALITLFAFAFGGVGGEKEMSKPRRVLVADDDGSAQSKKIIDQLDSLPEFRVKRMQRDSAEARVKKGDDAAVLVFHKGFSDSLEAGDKPPVEFKYDASKEAEIAILQGALTGKLMGMIGGKSMLKNALANFDRQYPDMDSASRAQIHAQIVSDMGGGQSSKKEESFIRTTSLIAEEKNSPGLIHAVAGTAIMMLLFAVIAMGASILEEKQEGTLKRLLYSPLPPNQILFGKMISANIISTLQLSIMFLFAKIAFGLDIFSHIIPLLLMILASAYACASFGMLIASFAKTRQQVQSMSTLIVLIMSCFGGSMIPTFAMPEFMQKMSVFTVNYWSIQGFYDIFWRRLELSDPTFLTRLGVLLLIGTVMNLIAVQLFKKNALKIA
ncbi:MAG: ABC transporter permease [Bacteroidia bacterium]